MVTQNNFVILCHCRQDTDGMTNMIVRHCNRSRLYKGCLLQVHLFMQFIVVRNPHSNFHSGVSSPNDRRRDDDGAVVHNCISGSSMRRVAERHPLRRHSD